MGRRIIRRILLYTGGLIFAFILGKCVWHLCFLSEYLFDVCLFYVPTVLYLIVFIAWPIGLSVGMYLIDKFLLRIPNHNAWDILVGCLTSLMGIALFHWVLPLLGIDILIWAPVVFGVNVDAYMFLFIAAFFSLIGYNSVGLFRVHLAKVQAVPAKRMDRKVNAQSVMSKETKELSKAKWRIPAGSKFALATLLISILTIFLLIICRPTVYKQERKARTFLEQVLSSINNQTQFYKEHSEKVTASEIEAHIPVISANYEVRLYNSNKGLHEYFITFDREHEFKVDISTSPNGFVLRNFHPIIDKFRENRRM